MTREDIKAKKRMNEDGQEKNRQARRLLEQTFSTFDSLLQKEKSIDESSISLFNISSEQPFFEQLMEDREQQSKELAFLMEESEEKLQQERKKLEDEWESLAEEERMENRKEEQDG